eukprot:4370263-Amphidinium_carterae.1
MHICSDLTAMMVNESLRQGLQRIQGSFCPWHGLNGVLHRHVIFQFPLWSASGNSSSSCTKRCAFQVGAPDLSQDCGVGEDSARTTAACCLLSNRSDQPSHHVRQVTATSGMN